MKKVLLALSLVCIANFSHAQITIGSSAIPAANDTFRFSNAQITSAIDPVPTGANFTWDFSFLQPVSQDIDTFRTVSSTGGTYALYFADLAFNSNRANQAKKGNLGVPNVPLGGGVTVSDVIAFYYKSSTLYQQTGYGATINGIGVPIGFNTKDVLYRFPMNFGDTDTSPSDFNINIPNLGYYGHDQVRVSEVDGWGTLITPYGTFNTLRIKSRITGTDTLFLDTLGFGFNFPSPETIEYKWLGTTKNIPLLQITMTGGSFGGAPQISSVTYRDSVRTLTSISEPVNPIGSMSVFPNPANDWVTISLNSYIDGVASIRLIAPDGRIVNDLWNGELYSGNNMMNLNLANHQLASGLYLLELQCAGKVSRSRILIGR
ncbi:MAG: T9SS type A sorting domain-containing protein [Arcticibacter sp.]